MVISILGAAAVAGAATLSFLFSYPPSSHDQKLLQQSSPQARNISLSELANSIKPIYPNATVVQGMLPSSIDGIALREIAKNTVSNSIIRDQKLGMSKGIEKEGLAEITLYMAADPGNDNNVVAVTLTNIGKDRFFLKQFAIGGQTSRTGMAPLAATVLDSDYSPQVWGSIPKPVLTRIIIMNPGDSISAYIKGKYNEEFTGELINVFGGSASYYYDKGTEDHNNGFGWSISTCSSQSLC
ncbi:MAG: hypothetical protein ACRD5H_06555 [Nitrososphaerales archaeon]